MDDRPEATQARCAQCGGANAPDASLCAHCGVPLAAEMLAAPSLSVPDADAPDASALIASATTLSTRPDAGPAVPEGQRRCEWCGELSPADEERCVHCEAVFPRPEQDAAFLRAAEERLRAANDTLAMMQRQRARRGLGRFFGR